MFPVLFSIASVPVSSLGIFLILALIYAIFLVWRLSRAWDIDEEKVLDLTFLTAFGALVGARSYFVLQYFNYFSEDLGRVLAIFKYPGLSFWGAFLGGWLTLYFASRKSRIDYGHLLDIAAVGFLGGLFLGDLGCLLGGCDVGRASGFLGVSMVGQVGRRFPVQLLEAVLVIIILLRIWPQATHFHTAGTVGSKILMWVGVVKFITEFFRASHVGGYFFSLVIITLGISLQYRFSRRSFKHDLSILRELLQKLATDNRFRKVALQNLYQSCYNWSVSSLNDTRIAIKWRFRNLGKVLRKLNVKSTTKNT